MSDEPPNLMPPNLTPPASLPVIAQPDPMGATGAPPKPTPATVDDTYNTMVKADWFFVAGLILTFIMGMACMVANFFKPASVPAEPIWALAGVVIGHKVSSDRFGT